MKINSPDAASLVATLNAMTGYTPENCIAFVVGEQIAEGGGAVHHTVFITPTDEPVGGPEMMADALRMSDDLTRPCAIVIAYNDSRITALSWLHAIAMGFLYIEDVNPVRLVDCVWVTNGMCGSVVTDQPGSEGHPIAVDDPGAIAVATIKGAPSGTRADLEQMVKAGDNPVTIEGVTPDVMAWAALIDDESPADEVIAAAYLACQPDESASDSYALHRNRDSIMWWVSDSELRTWPSGSPDVMGMTPEVMGSPARGFDDDNEQAHAALRLARTLSRMPSGPESVAPYCVVANMAWLAGSASLANIVVAEALKRDPENTLAQIMSLGFQMVRPAIRTA